VGVIHFDTSFLIDLQLELLREKPGGAFALIESLDEGELLAVSVHALSELRIGAEKARQPLKEHEALDQLVAGFLPVYPDQRFAAVYARAWVASHRGKRVVPVMDLLIATAAMVEDAPLVTRNVKDFSRIPGLRVLSY
jgi:tRNA(fMet)-specific endonuclease VapC